MERLRNVNVAESYDQSLVEQGGLDRGGFASEVLREPLGREGFAQWLYAETLEQSVLLQVLAVNEVDQAKTPRVVESDRGAVAEMEHDVFVFRHGRLVLVDLAERHAGAVDEEAPGHAEMHDQHFAIVEPGEQIFCPPIERFDLAPREPLAEMLGQRHAQVRPSLLNARKCLADENRLKSPPHSLDLWQLRHAERLFFRDAKSTSCGATIA